MTVSRSRSGDHNKALVGISDEHAYLVKLLGELSHSVDQEQINRSTVAAILDRIFDETREHFLHEEDLMYETGYVAYLEHKKDHAQILRQIENLIARYRTRAIDIESEAHRLIEQWMMSHFEKFDRDLVVTVAEKF